MRRAVFFAVVALVLLCLWRLGRPSRRVQAVPDEALASANDDLERDHADLMPEQVAVLLLKESQQAFAAARVLEAAGLPFTVTRDAPAALRHRMVFVPLDDQRLRLDRPRQEAFLQYVSSGGVLILQMPAADPWKKLTGLERVQPSQSRRRLSFRAPSDPGFALLDHPQQLSIPLASPRTRHGFWSAALFPLKGAGSQVLATFPDTLEPALTRRPIGRGFVYVIGAHLSDLYLRPQGRRDFDAHRTFANGFEPAADVWPLVFRAWYEHFHPFWARLRAAPGRARSVFLLSHSVGPGASLRQAEEFAAVESSCGARSTWFFQTNIMAENSASPFFDAKTRSLILRLAQAGHEIGSLSVAFSPDFEALPLGAGRQDPRDYRPVLDRGFTRDASLLGELGVSKDILESVLSTGAVRGFRSPDFSYPEALDWALRRAGYDYDSSLPANACLTHLPFRLIAWRAQMRETPLVELPITFADAKNPAESPSGRQILETARDIADHDGWIVWSLTPDGRREKTALLREVLAGLPSDHAAMAMRDAARFWLARSQARFSFAPGSSDKEWLLKLDLPAGSPGLAFAVSGELDSCACADLSVQVSCAQNVLTVDAPQARQAEIRLTLK